jgi:hypothetical protein
VPNVYRFKSSGRETESRDYDNTIAVADALYGHSRVAIPYRLLLVGY